MTQELTPPPPPALNLGHSKAFETLVEGPNDLVGLIAYALYKQSLREDATGGKVVAPSHSREPTATMRSVFRGDAEGRLQSFANEAFQAAAPDMIRDAIGVRLDAAITTVTAVMRETAASTDKEIARRTKWSSAVTAGVVAWFISIIVTLLVLAVAYQPNWVVDFTGWLQRHSG